MEVRTIPSASKYRVCDSGDVFNAETGRRLVPQSDHRAGYLKVRVRHNDGELRSRFVHHLVAETFLGERPEGMDIDHIDGNRTNNAAANLRYCTRRENQDNPNNAGPCHWQSLAMRRVVAIRGGEHLEFANASEAARVLGLCLSGVSNALSGKPVNKGRSNGKPRYCAIRTCGGYAFQFAS